MLVLRRREGQWLDVIHRSGDMLRIRVYDVGARTPHCVNLAFDDSPRNFAIHRPERHDPLQVVARNEFQEVCSGKRAFALD